MGKGVGLGLGLGLGTSCVSVARLTVAFRAVVGTPSAALRLPLLAAEDRVANTVASSAAARNTVLLLSAARGAKKGGGGRGEVSGG